MGLVSHASKRRLAFPLFVLVVQLAFIIALSLCYDYADDASGRNPTEKRNFGRRYPMFMDVQMMIFVGFGFLMTFLRRYGYGAISFNLLIAAMVAQWSLIIRPVLDRAFEGHAATGKMTIGIENLITADFAAAVVLISFGAVLGKLSPLQLLVMGLIETVLAITNECIGVHIFKVVDIGGSMFIHAFGAYFGLACTFAVFKGYHNGNVKEGSVYHSDLFSMIGTLFLWMCWPSFNGALADGDNQHRAIINTFLSLCGCVLFTFAFSVLVNKKAKINMVHIQNATIAGGVAIGTTADLFVKPYGAVLIGGVAGVVSVIGYDYITPVLASKARIHDTCGVNNLHGLPGIIAALAGVVIASLASYETYGDSLNTFFPQVLLTQNKEQFAQLNRNLTEDHYPAGRTPGEQAGYQLAALGVTMGIAILGGFFTGLFLRLPIFCTPTQNEIFDDDPLFELGDEEPSTFTYLSTKEELPLNAERFVISQEQWNALHVKDV